MIRRTVRWACVAACAALAALWLASARCSIQYGRSALLISLEEGCLQVLSWDRRDIADPRMPRGWKTGRSHRWQLWFSSWRTAGPWGIAWRVPLWMPAAVMGAAAGGLFWGRRHRPGHCRCGYDLSGLAAGAACPECGAKT